ncbi:DUF6879 family protein [Streptomyces angustmyceticus]|uniref:DUF6879 family protein n=1 Tax=Streptomyces angustmyceticus TaxID=285578 RepID=UPI003D8A848A
MEHASEIRGVRIRGTERHTQGPPSPQRTLIPGRPDSPLATEGIPEGGHQISTFIDLNEFGKLFQTFQHSAWRLETRRGYASDREDATYREFVETGTVAWDLDDDWCRNMCAQTADGKRVGRVRIIDDPPTTGQLYLLDNAKRNSATGEDMRNLWRADAERLQLPAEDFWIFDSRVIALLHFDEADTLLHVELLTEPAEVVRYAQVRDAAIHHSSSFEHFTELVAARRHE